MQNANGCRLTLREFPTTRVTPDTKTRRAGAPWRYHAAAAGVVAIATLLRLLVDSQLGDNYPYLTYVGAVALVAWRWRTSSAVLSVVLGAVLANLLFAPEDGSLWVGTALYLLMASVIVAMSHELRGARWRCEDLLDEADGQQERLRQLARAEAEQREKLSTTLASIGDAVIATDIDGRVTMLNPAAEFLTGWTTTEAAGLPLTQVFEIVNEDTRLPVDNPALRALRDGVVVGLANHTILIAKDGVERPIDDSAAPIRGTDGDIIGCVLVFRDISERKALEAARHEAQQLLAATLDGVSEGFVRYDRDWRIVYVNAEAERINQIPREQTIGRTPWDLYPDVLGTHFETELRRAMTDQDMIEFETCYEPWGRWYIVKAYPMADGGLTTLVREITAQKAQRDALEASEARFRELADAMPQIVYSNDANGHVDFANRQWLEYSGQPDAQTADLTPVVHPDDLDDMVDRWDRARRTETTLEAEFRLRRAADGEYRWFLTRSVPVRDAEGRVVKWFGTSTDIHDQKRTEQQLAESEARHRASGELAERQRRLYETVLSNTPDLAYVFDLQHRFTYANRALLEMWGRTWDEAIGNTCLEIGYEPWHAAMHDREIDHVVATGQPIRGEVAFDGTNGRREYDYIFVPVFGADGDVEAVAGTTRDITDRLVAEAQLRANQERQTFLITLSDAIRRMSDPVAVQAETSRILGEWLGASRVTYFEVRDGAFVVEQDYVDGVPSMVGSRPMTGFGAEMLSAYRDGRTVIEDDVDAEGSRTSQERKAFETIKTKAFVGVPLIKDGDFVAGLAVHATDAREWSPTEVAIIEDTAERTWDAVERVRAEAALRLSEERFRTLFITMDEGFCIVEMEFDHAGNAIDYRIEDMNAAFEIHTGMRGLVGRSIREAMPSLEAFWYEKYGRVASTGVPVQFIHHAEPLGRWFDVSAFRLGGTGSNKVAILFNDITRRKSAELDREQLFSQLEAQDRRKDEFLATLAHELRNPLAPLSNGLQIIRMAGAEGIVEKARSMMERQLLQMTRLVDDLLDVSRVTTGMLELRQEWVELRTVIASALETSRPLIEQGGHELAVEVPEESILVYGDPIRLAQVVSNLLTNSAKYTRRGGHIRISVTRDGREAVVTVADDGIGIPTDMLESVFGMFKQVDRTLEKTTGGLGIGLSLVKGLVEMHAGTVEARSAGEGTGSEFVVRLPAARAASSLVEPFENEPHADTRIVSRRILVVDDNVDSADSLGQLLEMMGHDVRMAYDGEEGVIVADELRPSVVLCDIAMPKLNGYDFARRLRSKPWGTHIVLVALSGWSQDDDLKRSVEAGFDEHMVKPVDAATLSALLTGLRPATD